MKSKGEFYSIIDHTADLGISVKGHNIKDLFENTGKALLDLLFIIKAPVESGQLKISITGHDLADLMVKWLSEILYLFEGENLVVSDLGIDSINDRELDGYLYVTSFDSRIHEVIREIKAVTYHQIEVKEIDNFWITRVIFDL